MNRQTGPVARRFTVELKEPSWAVLRLTGPQKSMPVPDAGGSMPVLKVFVEVQSLEGETVQLERAGVDLPVLSPMSFVGLNHDELVAHHLVELAAAEAH